MIRRLLLFLLLSVVTLLSADFWDDKPPSDWTDEQVEALLTDSPWAITKTIAQGAILGSSGRIAPRRRARIGGSPRTIEFTVRWLSAGPMREAFKRQLAVRGRTGNQVRQIETMLSQADSHYMIMVADMPGNIIQQTNVTEPQLQSGSLLKAPGRFETAPSRVQMQRGGGEAQMIFFFPRTKEISIEDKKIEFQMKIGATTINREFKPREMTVDGRLAL